MFNVSDNEKKELDHGDVSQCSGNLDGSNWNDGTFKNDALWDNLYNLELGEWRTKKGWKTPASCMDGHQRRILIKVIETITKMFAWYSQQPYTGWPEQEWVLLQLTNINGVGDKDPNNHQQNSSQCLWKKRGHRKVQ
jgi:hypothetical protein